jgi:hypothetical protein
MPSPTQSLRRTLALAVTSLVTLAAGLVTAPVQASTVVTPGDFTGYGFDQCTAPSQRAMDAWLTGSPYWAVGIYISGDSRFCLRQPNLTTRWVDTQLARGWRLLPITLGPQAWCTTRERYLHQVRISPTRASGYSKARRQGRAEARKTVNAARALGIARGSTLWYDVEAFNIHKTDCRESVLSFVSAWTNQLHALGYVSGFYSSGASGIKMIDDARVNRPGRFTMPDRLWVADWNGRAGVSSSYVRPGGWMPHRRVHQYRGGHDERYGGVTINVDSDFLDLGRGSVARPAPKHCGGVRIDFPAYAPARVGDRGALVKAAQCLLKEKKLYAGRVNGVFGTALAKAVRKYRAAHGLTVHAPVSRATWTALLSQGHSPLMKYGSAGPAVRRLQRALNAAGSARLAVTGTFEGRTTAAVKAYQRGHRLSATGVVTGDLWKLLHHGTR